MLGLIQLIKCKVRRDCRYLNWFHIHFWEKRTSVMMYPIDYTAPNTKDRCEIGFYCKDGVKVRVSISRESFNPYPETNTHLITWISTLVLRVHMAWWLEQVIGHSALIAKQASIVHPIQDLQPLPRKHNFPVERLTSTARKGHLSHLMWTWAITASPNSLRTWKT